MVIFNKQTAQTRGRQPAAPEQHLAPPSSAVAARGLGNNQCLIQTQFSEREFSNVNCDLSKSKQT